MLVFCHATMVLHPPLSGITILFKMFHPFDDHFQSINIFIKAHATRKTYNYKWATLVPISVVDMYNHLLQQKYLLTHSDTLYWGHKVNWYIKGYLTFSILTSSIIFTNAFYLFCPGTFSSPWDSDTMGPLFAKQNGGHNLAISWTVLFGLKIFSFTKQPSLFLFIKQF